MAKGGSEQTIRNLLDAGRDLVAEHGAARLTLDAVVKRAGMSKGAILYHFKTKDDLTRQLFQDAVDAFDARVAEKRGNDRSPGSYTRAYIAVTTAPHAAGSAAAERSVISALAADGVVGAILEQTLANWSSQVENDGLDPALAQLVRLAADGLWMMEAAGANPVSAGLRQDVSAHMLRLIDASQSAQGQGSTD
mgnify:CR=1 FL=1